MKGLKWTFTDRLTRGLIMGSFSSSYIIGYTWHACLAMMMTGKVICVVKAWKDTILAYLHACKETTFERASEW